MLKTSTSEKLSSAEEKKFTPAVTGTSNSVFSSISKILSDSNIKSYLVKNIGSEHLSKIYASNHYSYSYYNYSVDIDVSTKDISSEETSNETADLINGISGQLSKNTYCSQYTPNFTGTGANMFISYEFMQNAVDYSIENYDSWKNILYSKKASSYVPILQFMVADHEFLVDGLVQYLADYFYSPVEYRCQASKNLGGEINQQDERMYQTITWHCQAVAMVNESTEVTFMGNFKCLFRL